MVVRVRVSTRWAAILLGVGSMLALGCEDERPPAPPAEARSDAPGSAAADSAAAGSSAAEAYFEPGASPAVLTYAGDRGTFADTSKPDAIPEEARGLVRVTLLEGEAAPPGAVWVANLREPEADGRYRLRTVPRDMFEELALGEGRGSAIELPEGLEPPPTVAAATHVVVYKTAWCGVCKKVEGYLARKGVEYEAKDIEKDRAAAAELQAKAQAQGVRTGSVPVIDVGGQLIVGFDRARLEKLL